MCCVSIIVGIADWSAADRVPRVVGCCPHNPRRRFVSARSATLNSQGQHRNQAVLLSANISYRMDRKVTFFWYPNLKTERRKGVGKK